MELKEAIGESGLSKLKELDNNHVTKIIEEYVRLCMPERVHILTDSDEDIAFARERALEHSEESRLGTHGHTVHFDGLSDQGRDKENTRILMPKGRTISRKINTADREECLKEVFQLLSGIMKGKEMYVRFYCLGPNNSRFSIPALQITDSAYVAHSEDLLYRPGYEEFRRLHGGKGFFYFVHSAGELENGVSKNTDKRRIYMDLEGNRVFSVNTQYAGNSIGLKKLALRLAIKKSHDEEWLCEHMLIMGARRKGRTTYFTGAFPSACGKTSTAMIPGQTIVGDDIAYLRPGKEGKAYAANVEQGIFGIIEDINPVDDPLIFKTLTTPRELIFSNVLVDDGRAFWNGMGMDMPEEGENYAGKWKAGDRDSAGKEILPSHRNARYTLRIRELENADRKTDDPEGVQVSGIIYGGRDSDTNPPIVESFSWAHGVFIGACLESETTAATLGKMGVRTHDPMANLDFLVIPLGTYIRNHLKFGDALDSPPRIFATNYFLKENGAYLNHKVDKKVWLMWMEGRVHNEYEAIETPIGMIPLYEDLRELFREIFSREYSREKYEKEFSIRIDKLLERLSRIETIYREEEDVPDVFYEHLEQQRKRLLDSKEKYGKETISPEEFK